MSEKLEKEIKIVVSDQFVDIYRNLNVENKIEDIKELRSSNIEEFYLLLLTCIDKHSDEDSIVILNLKEFKDEVMEIYKLQDDEKVDNVTLKKLVEITNDTYIDTKVIYDKNGDKLPEPYTLVDIRNIKIDIITGKED